MRKALSINAIIFLCILVIVTGCAVVSELETNTFRNINQINRTDPVYFTEDSSIAVSEFLNQSFGVKKIVIQKGDYVIDFRENPNGKIEFRVDEEESDFEEIADGPLFQISIAIRIAKRKSRHYSCTCCSGIGFGCGFATITSRVDSYSDFERSNTDQKNKYASVSYDRFSRTIRLDFMQQINWQEFER